MGGRVKKCERYFRVRRERIWAHVDLIISYRLDLEGLGKCWSSCWFGAKEGDAEVELSSREWKFGGCDVVVLVQWGRVFPGPVVP